MGVEVLRVYFRYGLDMDMNESLIVDTYYDSILCMLGIHSHQQVFEQIQMEFDGPMYGKNPLESYR